MDKDKIEITGALELESKVEKVIESASNIESTEEKLTDEQMACRNRMENVETVLNIGSFAFPAARPAVALMKLGRSGLEMITGKDLCGVAIEKTESKKETLKNVAEIGIDVVGNATGLNGVAQTAAKFGSGYGIDSAFENNTKKPEDASIKADSEKVKNNIKSIREKSFASPELSNASRLQYKN